jgi:hypothetical protein
MPLKMDYPKLGTGDDTQLCPYMIDQVTIGILRNIPCGNDDVDVVWPVKLPIAQRRCGEWIT